MEKLKDEKIKINNTNIKAEKFIFNASINPKDKGPFPEYTLWYYDDELIKMQFINPKDKNIPTNRLDSDTCCCLHWDHFWRFFRLLWRSNR